MLTSDGHVAEASGVGVALEEVPCAAGAELDDALGGGEDYELLITTARPDEMAAAFEAAGLAPPLRIGACVADASVRTLAGGPLPAGGWEHPFA